MTNSAIKKWMELNHNRFIDDCNELNCTAIVEAWDEECGSGDETLDPNHPAWDIAVEILVS